jgi:hypothetical protein
MCAALIFSGAFTPQAAAHADGSGSDIQVNFTKWHIKGTAKDTWDLRSIENGLTLPNQIWDGYGLHFPNMNIKVGTVSLAKKFPANAVLEFHSWGDSYPRMVIVFYKNKKKADVYGVFNMTSRSYYKDTKPQYKYGKSYRPETGTYIRLNPADYLAGPNARGYYSESFTTYFENTARHNRVVLGGASVYKAVNVLIKNKKETAKGKTDKKNIVYKVGKKYMATHKTSISCDYTAADIRNNAEKKSKKSTRVVLYLPLHQLKTGDQLGYTGWHTQIYAGSGVTYNGSVSSKKTYIGRVSNERGPVVERHIYNIFRYAKK